MKRTRFATPDLKKRLKRMLTPALVIHHEILIRKARGVYIQDEDGKSYLDFTSGVAVTNVGHNHPKIIEAIKAQAEALVHTGCVFYCEPLVTLPEMLSRITPPGLDMFFFSNSGAEAVEGALKLARFYTKRQGIIAFTGSFHGRTFGALTLTTSSAHYRSRYHPLLPSVYHSPYPYCYRCHLGLSPDSCSMECYEYLERLFKHLIAPEEVACIIIEPVLGEGGYVVPPTDFLRRLRGLCDKWEILLVFDEVQSGMGRTGRWFSSEHFGVVPDIMVIAKGIANGLPLSAVISKRQIMGGWPPGAHGTTFGGNPVAMSASIATLRVIEEERLLENACSVGSFAIERLNALKSKYPSIGDVRGLGLMIGVEFVKKGKEPDTKGLRKIARYCRERGLLIIECGTDKNVIRVAPPLIIKKKEMERGLGILEGAIAKAL